MSLLAVLDIEDGRTAAVRDLAAELAAVFEGPPLSAATAFVNAVPQLAS